MTTSADSRPVEILSTIGGPWDPSTFDPGPLRQRPASEPLSSTPVYRGDGGDGDLSVDGGALRHFAQAMRNAAGQLGPAVDQMRGVRLRPGAFSVADTIRAGIGDLAHQYAEKLRNTRDGLLVLADRMEDLADRYTTVEELNTTGADEVLAMLATFAQYLPTDPVGGNG
ncbi:hypothetical protein [Krasilnikovia sp. M28-CT-15]|uniref:hypothetical protein n=1 Tax=Krasilnikovia sp. M28-CT-15 TaxID=3373540 RepID=UPI0038776361